MVRISKCSAVLAISVSTALAGCAAVDHFEPRAHQYNKEAASTKSNVILLNILRASRRLPLQFTEYTSAVGQSFLSGQVAATIPVATFPANAAKTYTVNPQLQSNVQNQVTVSNLNSQEFYYGLQTPLTQQMLATLMAAGYDPDLVLMLAVSSLKRTSKVLIDELPNDPTDPNRFAQFYDAIKLLLLGGLSFETQQGDGQDIGPELNEDEAKALLPHYIKASATAAANGSASSLPELKQQGNRYQLKKSKSSFRICFRKANLDFIAARRNPNVRKLNINVSRSANNYVVHLKLTNLGPDRLFDMTILPSHLCGAPPDASHSKDKSPPINWNFEMRSVEAIYNYLGQIVRAEWSDPETFENAYQLPRDFGGLPFFLFKVYPGYAPGAVISADLGSTYSILPTTPPQDQDRSTQVISLLTDLWAIDSSAKSFPTTNTISVTTQ